MSNHAKRLAQLASRGGSAAEITAVLAAEGFKTSRSSVGRELRKLRGAQRVGRRPDAPSPAPARARAPAAESQAPEEDEDTDGDPKTLDDLQAMAGRALRLAESSGNLPALARFGNLATAILEAKRKGAPPDVLPAGTFVTSEEMEKCGKQAAARMHALVADLFGQVESCPKCSACGQRIVTHIVEEFEST